MNYTNIILIIIALYFFKNITTSKVPIYVSNKPEVEVNIVTPQFVYQALNNKINNIILVNVLSDKMKYKITLNGFNDPRSLSKREFEKLLKKNNNQIPDSIDKVIIYCASWSCNAAKNYHNRLFKELKDNDVNIKKIVDYIGGIHEWSTYADITPSIFSFHSTETNQVLNHNQVRDIRLDTAHDYFVNNVLQPGYIKNVSKQKNDFKNYL